MIKKNVFDWRGEPSVWTTDKKLKSYALLVGQNYARQTPAKIGLEAKGQVNVYSKAKIGK
jgi:hypothetical protein